MTTEKIATEKIVVEKIAAENTVVENTVVKNIVVLISGGGSNLQAYSMPAPTSAWPVG